MPVPISNVTRRVVYAASGTGPYAFTFEILAATDIAVYRDDTLLTLTTNYTVTINANGTGSITLTAAPTGATQIAIVGNRNIQRTTDFVTGGDFFANTLNDELDQQTIFNQQNAEGLQRALSAPQTDPTSINMTLPRAALRANKALGFDANGNPAIADTLGTNRGNWAASTLYYVRDIVKDTSNSNVWQCITQHTSSGSQPINTNADAAKWFLLVDAASAGTSATNAAASASAAATSASNASTSASNAATSASNAASSASTATTQAGLATTAATNSANSETNAAASASAASASAASAANSQSTASTFATSAQTSAALASSSASSASTNATNAAASASTATTQAGIATTQASNASTSASNASTSETNAANSAAAAAASYDSFDDRYLGSKAANPTLDNDGNALLTGALYFNSAANEMRVYTGSAWQALPTLPDLTVEKSFKATAGQTNYTFAGGYRVGFTYVWVNGALLYSDEYTATGGSTITFGTALTLNDEVRILTFKAAGSITALDTGALPLTGGTVTGATVITDNSTSAALRITQTGTGNVLLVEDSANPDSSPFVVNSSGNVGIGISSPTSRLHISGSISLSGNVSTSTGEVNCYYLNASVINDRTAYAGTVVLLNTDTQVDVDLTLLLLADVKYTNFFDFRVVGTYVSDPAAGSPTVARVAKSWQQAIFYSGTTWTIGGATLYGTAYQTDATNFPVGAVNATRILSVVNTTQVLLRLVNRTSPAATANTTFHYQVEHWSA